MDPVGWVATVIAGLLSGAVGGVLASGEIARRTEAARDRYKARAAIRAALIEYRDLLKYDHDQLYVKSSYPESYASVSGQEAMAQRVLSQLPALKVADRENIRERLRTLIGQASLDWVEKYLWVPKHERDSERDDSRQAMELVKALHSQEDEGSLRRLLKSQNDPNHALYYAETVSAFDELIAIVSSK